MRVSIGIDLGSSRVKLLALDESGECLGVTMASYATDSRRAGYAEQNPDRWWDALRLAMSELLARPALRGATVVALGLTGQMHGAVFLDDNGSPVRPALMWSDGRAEAETARSRQRIPRDELVARTGNRSNVSFTAPKIMWVGRNEPQSWQRPAGSSSPRMRCGPASPATWPGTSPTPRRRSCSTCASGAGPTTSAGGWASTAICSLHCPNPRRAREPCARTPPERSDCRPASRWPSEAPTRRPRHSAWDWLARKTRTAACSSPLAPAARSLRRSPSRRSIRKAGSTACATWSRVSGASWPRSFRRPRRSTGSCGCSAPTIPTARAS